MARGRKKKKTLAKGERALLGTSSSNPEEIDYNLQRVTTYQKLTMKIAPFLFVALKGLIYLKIFNLRAHRAKSIKARL